MTTKNRPPVRQSNGRRCPNPRISDTARALIDQLVDRRYHLGLRGRELAALTREPLSKVYDFENLRHDAALSRFLRYAEVLGLRVELVEVAE